MTNGTSGKRSLGRYLASLRVAHGLTLREVEDATKGTVSNAYLSQIENEKITHPSPNLLHSLADVYGVSYAGLMQRAGYVVEKSSRADTAKHGRVATFANKNLTKEEEEELLEYLAFLRSRRRPRK